MALNDYDGHCNNAMLKEFFANKQIGKQLRNITDCRTVMTTENKYACNQISMQV